MFDIGLIYKFYEENGEIEDVTITARMGCPKKFEKIGPLYMSGPGLCSYATFEHLECAWAHEGLVYAFIPSGVIPPDHLKLTYVWCDDDDPQYEFFRFHNWFIETGHYRILTPQAQSIINGQWVQIVKGKNVDIHPSAAVGVSGLRVIRRKHGETFRCLHGGYVTIDDDTLVGPHSIVVKSVWATPTRIGKRVHIGNRVTIGHNVTIGDDVIIAPNVVVCGHAEIGDKVTIGAGAIINNGVRVGKRAVVSAGSLVTKDVNSGERVTGNFAVPHQRWVEFVKSVAKPTWDSDYFMTGYSGIPNVKFE